MSKKILLVCLGNICRSPIAEGLLRKKSLENGLDWTIDSASTNTYHTGQPPHNLSQRVCKMNDVDISEQRSRLLTQEDFTKYDVIYAMAEDVMTDIKKIAGTKFIPAKSKYFLSEKEGSLTMDVPDPWYGEEDGYLEVYALLDGVCDLIIEKAKKETK